MLNNRFTEKLVSIIIPVYKTEESKLRSCIESILNQDYKNIQLILVDDGSPDNCGRICDEYAVNNICIEVIHQENHGVSAARNAGLGRRNGQYLMFVDSDDSLRQGALSSLISLFELYNTDCIVYGWINEDASGSEEISVTDRPRVLMAGEYIETIAKENTRYGGGYPWNKIWNLKNILAVHEGLPLFDTGLSVYEDKLWIMETMLPMDSMVLIPQILYNYGYCEDGLSQGELTVKRQFGAYEGYKKICLFLKNKNRAAYKNAIWFHGVTCCEDLRILLRRKPKDVKRILRTMWCFLVMMCKQDWGAIIIRRVRGIANLVFKRNRGEKI